MDFCLHDSLYKLLAQNYRDQGKYIHVTLNMVVKSGGMDPEQYKLFQRLQDMEATLESFTLPKYLGNYVNWISSLSREIPST